MRPELRRQIEEHMNRRIAALEAQLRERDEQLAKARKALEVYAQDYDHERRYSMWDGGSRARQTLATLATTPDARTGAGEDWTPNGLHRPTLMAVAEHFEDLGSQRFPNMLRALAEPQEKP